MLWFGSGDAASRVPQTILIGSTVLGSWLGMQVVHECGHVLGAWLTGGQVGRVVLHPLTISRTDVVENPCPLLVVWAGPVVGVAIPLLLWAIAAVARLSVTFLFRFFAGFCLIANGLYIGIGSFDRVGDCGEMLRHGSAMWHLWIFGAVTTPAGLFMWHRQGSRFGLGAAKGQVSRNAAWGSLLACAALLVLGFAVGGE